MAGLTRERLGAEAAEEFCRACHTATGGNPLFVRELLGALRAAGVAPSAAAAGEVQAVGPAAVSRFVLHRLARLGPAASELARTVAVLGDDCELRLAARMSGSSADAAHTAADDLVRADILARGAISASSTRSCARRCTRTSGRVSARRGTPPPPRRWRPRAPAPSASPPTCC